MTDWSNTKLWKETLENRKNNIVHFSQGGKSIRTIFVLYVKRLGLGHSRRVSEKGLVE